MSAAFCEKEKAEFVDRWTPEGCGRRKPQERIANHPASPHHTLAAILYIFLWSIIISINAAGQTALEAPQTSFPPGMDIRISALPEVATIGDPIQIDLDITVPEGYQVKITEPELQMGDFTKLDFFPGPLGMQPEAAKDPIPTETLHHHRARIIAAVYKTGTFTFPSLPVNLLTPNGKEITLSSPPLDIEIRSVLIDENPKLKDLKKQAEITEPIRWTLWFILAIAMGVFGTIIWYYWRKRRRRPVSYTPEQIRNLLEIAESDLKELLSRGLPEDGMEKEFYVLLSGIVKKIIESGYEIPTAEQTTSEIMDSLNHRSAPESEDRERIESFLIRCDVVKFAKYVPSTAEHESVSKDALQILAQAKKAVSSRQSAVGSEL